MSTNHALASPTNTLAMPIRRLDPTPRSAAAARAIAPATESDALLLVPAGVKTCDVPRVLSPLAMAEASAPCLEVVPSVTTFGSRGAVLREVARLGPEDGIGWVQEETEVPFVLRFSQAGTAILELMSDSLGFIWSNGDGPSPTAFAIIQRASQVYGPSPVLNQLLETARPLADGELRWLTPRELHADGEHAVATVSLNGETYRVTLSHDEYEPLEILSLTNLHEAMVGFDLDGNGNVAEELGSSKSTEHALVEERIRGLLLRDQMFGQIEVLRDTLLVQHPGSFDDDSLEIDRPVELFITVDGVKVRAAESGEQAIRVATLRLHAYDNRAQLVTEMGQRFSIEVSDELVLGEVRRALSETEADVQLAHTLNWLLTPPKDFDTTDGWNSARFPIDAAEWSDRYPQHADLFQGIEWVRFDGHEVRLFGPEGSRRFEYDALASLREELQAIISPHFSPSAPIMIRLREVAREQALRAVDKHGEPVLDGGVVHLARTPGSSTRYRLYNLETFEKADVDPDGPAFFEPAARIEVAAALRPLLERLIDPHGESVELDPQLWASMIEGLTEFGSVEPDEVFSGTAWRAFNVDPEEFDTVRDLLIQRHGVRPRKWLGWMNDYRERPVLEAVTNVAERFEDLDPSFLYTVAIGEGMNLLVELSYGGPDGVFERDYIDGFRFLGTDVFGDDVDLLRRRGLLPEPFQEGVHYYIQSNTNELGQEVSSGDYVSVAGGPPALENGLSALAAMLINTQRGLLKLAREKGHDPDTWSASEINYLAYVGFNAGYGTARRYLDALRPGDSPLRQWVGGDEGGSSMRVHYNAGLRISTWELLKSLKVWDRLEDSRFDVREQEAE